jgi:hypothetical protein
LTQTNIRLLKYKYFTSIDKSILLLESIGRGIAVEVFLQLAVLAVERSGGDGHLPQPGHHLQPGGEGHGVPPALHCTALSIALHLTLTALHNYSEAGKPLLAAASLALPNFLQSESKKFPLGGTFLAYPGVSTRRIPVAGAAGGAGGGFAAGAPGRRRYRRIFTGDCHLYTRPCGPASATFDASEHRVPSAIPCLETAIFRKYANTSHS